MYRLQVIQFVDETSGFSSGPANPNRYYANAVHHSVHSTTGLFDRNTDGDISAAILADVEFEAGGVNIAAGVNDLRARFTSGEAATANGGRFAVVVTDGFDAPGPLATAAQALKDEDVAVIAVAPPGMSNMQNLQAIASSPNLALQVSSLNEIAGLLLSTVAGIGAHRVRPCMHVPLHCNARGDRPRVSVYDPDRYLTLKVFPNATLLWLCEPETGVTGPQPSRMLARPDQCMRWLAAEASPAPQQNINCCSHIHSACQHVCFPGAAGCSFVTASRLVTTPGTDAPVPVSPLLCVLTRRERQMAGTAEGVLGLTHGCRPWTAAPAGTAACASARMTRSRAGFALIM